MIEPPRKADSMKWLFMTAKMKTILIDDEVRKETMKEPHQGLRLRENVGRSEPSTEKTISQQNSI